MNLSERVKGILLKPKQEWQTISKETTVIPELYKTYVVILAAIGPVASIIGMSIVGISIPFVGSFRVSIFASISSAIVHYILTLVGVYVLALIIDALAPTFSGRKSLNQAFKVAAYSYTPGLVVGVVGIIPSLSPLMILGLYGFYLLYLGLPVVMESPQEKSLGYTIAVIIAAIVIFMVIGFISRAFISYPAPGMPIPR
jgi:sterol desaturase/sphingolipid hydroxylase (fatty acid hydroxylase superfamily)